MKNLAKVFIAFVFMLSAAVGVAQNGFTPVYILADTGQTFNRVIEIGTPVYIVSLNKFYMTEVRIGEVHKYTGGWLIASASRYSQPDFTGATNVTTDYILATYIKGTHSNITTDSAATVVASTKVKTPFLDGTYLKGTHSNVTADSSATVVASTKVKSPFLDGTYLKGTHSQVTADSSTSVVTGTLKGDTLTQRVIKFTALTGSDTTYKRTGLIQIGTDIYWGNGTYYYKIKL